MVITSEVITILFVTIRRIIGEEMGTFVAILDHNQQSILPQHSEAMVFGNSAARFERLSGHHPVKKAC